VQSPSNTPISSMGIVGRSIRFASAVVLMLAVGLLLHSRSFGHGPWPRVALSSMPMHLDGWSVTDFAPDKETLALFGNVEFLVREYKKGSEPQPGINLLIEYFPTQAGDAMFGSLKRRPSPWPSTPREVVQIVRPDGTSLPVNRGVVSTFGGRDLVLYWFRVGGRNVASELWAKYYLLSDSIRLNRSDGAMVGFYTPMLDGESPEAAQQRVMKLGFQLLPLIDNCLPRADLSSPIVAEIRH
jgi:EpsI family protein